MASLVVTFTNNRVYNVTEIDVLVGEPFQLDLTPDVEGDETRWFVENDPVLDIRVEETHADCKAVEEGESEIRIFGGTGTLIMTVNIKVVGEILPMATDLEATVGTPRPKK